MKSLKIEAGVGCVEDRVLLGLKEKFGNVEFMERQRDKFAQVYENKFIRDVGKNW